MTLSHQQTDNGEDYGTTVVTVPPVENSITFISVTDKMFNGLTERVKQLEIDMAHVLKEKV